MVDDSSRGPGQFDGQPDMAPKPDVCAPVPYTVWGTSAAAPQAAGVAALLVGKNLALTAADVRHAVVQGATSLGLAHDCEGAGQVDGAASLAL
jgi:serine protease AprX